MPNCDSSYCFTNLIVSFAIIGLILFLSLYSKYGGTSASGFVPQSDPTGFYTSGKDLRFQAHPSQAYPSVSGLKINRRNGFMGAPEPPTFYDIGDLAATQAAIEDANVEFVNSSGTPDPGLSNGPRNSVRWHEENYAKDPSKWYHAPTVESTSGFSVSGEQLDRKLLNPY